MARPAPALMLLGALLCAVVLGGCGGGEEPGSRPAAPSTGSSAASTSSAASSTQASAPATTATTPAAAVPGASTAAQTTSASPQSTSPQSASQIGASADAICVRRNHELKAAPLAGGGLAATAGNASRRAAIERRALGELSALSPPAGSAKQWQAMLNQTTVVLAEVVKLAADARAGDTSGVTHLIKASADPQFRLFAAADNAGAGHCEVVG